MAVELNHTIVPVRDAKESAGFLAEILGLDAPAAVGPFMAVTLSNGVTLDYADFLGSVPGHYAFLVSEDEFEGIFGRIRAQGITYWADPFHKQEGELNDKGRGFYFEDPSGNNLEVLTRA